MPSWRCISFQGKVMSRFVFFETPRAVVEAAAPLYAELAAMRMRVALARLMLKYNFDPAQPRVPAGSPDGGRWTDAGGTRFAGGAEEDESNRAGRRSAVIENPMAELRQAAFANHIVALRRLDPANSQLSYIVGLDFVPRQEQVDALGDEVETAKNKVANRISSGHAFQAHGSEFGSPSQAELGTIVRRVLDYPSRVVDLPRGRTIFYDRPSNTLVFVNPADRDGGTVFRPADGERYIDKAKEQK
jgi:hypothetical protein